MLQKYVDSLVHRALRLLHLPSEFEREAREIAARAAALPTVTTFEATSDQYWRARDTPWLNEVYNELMLQFYSDSYGMDILDVSPELNALYDVPLYGMTGPDEPFDDRARYATYIAGVTRFRGNEEWWAWYEETSQLRHAWGIFFRSSYDWDWDPSESFKWLYNTKQREIELKDDQGDTIDISMKATQQGRPSLPKQIRVAYETKMGKTKYRTFYANASESSESEEEESPTLELDDTISVSGLEGSTYVECSQIPSDYCNSRVHIEETESEGDEIEDESDGDEIDDGNEGDDIKDDGRDDDEAIRRELERRSIITRIYIQWSNEVGLSR